MIHAMIRSSVPTSGAGTSLSGPMNGRISLAYRRVSRSSSPVDIVEGSSFTPPLAPPYGIPTSAHFQVIHIASALTSSRLTSGW